MLKDLYWDHYDYYGATAHLAKRISQYNRDTLDECPQLSTHGHSGRDVGKIVHTQVELMVKNRDAMDAKSLRKNPALHPYVKNVFLELGRNKLRCIATEVIVYDVAIECATKIDLVCLNCLYPNELILIEMKVGYPAGSWYASSTHLKSPLASMGNSPYHHASLQIIFGGEMMWHRLRLGTTMRVATLHVMSHRAVLEEPPINLVKMTREIYESAKLRALRNPKLGRRRKTKRRNKKKGAVGS